MCMLFSAVICMAQSPIGTERVMANSQITVRIPSLAIITLPDNNSKEVSYKSSADLRKLVKSEISPVADVVSNRKWSVNVYREEYVSGTYTSASTGSKAVNTHTTTPHSLRIIYITSLN